MSRGQISEVRGQMTVLIPHLSSVLCPLNIDINTINSKL